MSPLQVAASQLISKVHCHIRKVDIRSLHAGLLFSYRCLTGIRGSMILGRCFDNGLRRVEVATR